MDVSASQSLLPVILNCAKRERSRSEDFSPAILPSFGVTKILIATLSLIPSTSFVGVILATGWMGGAISAHVRVKSQYVVQVIIPVLIWIGFGLPHQSAMHSLLGL